MSRETFNPEKFMASVAIDQNNLTSGMADNSALLAYYGMQAALWRAAFDNFKIQVEVRSSEIALDLKNSGAKVSQGTADETVSSHEDIKKLKRAQLATKEQLDLYTSAMNAIDDRGRMLSSIGAWKRQEMSGHFGGMVHKPEPDHKMYYGSPTSITPSFISAGTITSATLAASEVTGSKIATGTVAVGKSTMTDEERKALVAKLTAKTSVEKD